MAAAENIPVRKLHKSVVKLKEQYPNMIIPKRVMQSDISPVVTMDENEIVDWYLQYFKRLRPNITPKKASSQYSIDIHINVKNCSSYESSSSAIKTCSTEHIDNASVLPPNKSNIPIEDTVKRKYQQHPFEIKFIPAKKMRVSSNGIFATTSKQLESQQMKPITFNEREKQPEYSLKWVPVSDLLLTNNRNVSIATLPLPEGSAIENQMLLASKNSVKARAVQVKRTWNVQTLKEASETISDLKKSGDVMNLLNDASTHDYPGATNCAPAFKQTQNRLSNVPSVPSMTCSHSFPGRVGAAAAAAMHYGTPNALVASSSGQYLSTAHVSHSVSDGKQVNASKADSVSKTSRVGNAPQLTGDFYTPHRLYQQRSTSVPAVSSQCLTHSTSLHAGRNQVSYPKGLPRATSLAPITNNRLPLSYNRNPHASLINMPTPENILVSRAPQGVVQHHVPVKIPQATRTLSPKRPNVTGTSSQTNRPLNVNNNWNSSMPRFPNSCAYRFPQQTVINSDRNPQIPNSALTTGFDEPSRNYTTSVIPKPILHNMSRIVNEENSLPTNFSSTTSNNSKSTSVMYQTAPSMNALQVLPYLPPTDDEFIQTSFCHDKIVCDILDKCKTLERATINSSSTPKVDKSSSNADINQQKSEVGHFHGFLNQTGNNVGNHPSTSGNVYGSLYSRPSSVTYEQALQSYNAQQAVYEHKPINNKLLRIKNISVLR